MRTGAHATWPRVRGLVGRGATTAAVSLAVLAMAACTSSNDEPTASAPPSSTTVPSTPSDSAPSDDTGNDGAPDASAPNGSSGGSNGSEGMPTPTAVPTALLPPPEVVVLSGPMPASGSANGELVTGYPSEIVPVVEGVTVVTSSVSSQGDRLQLGLQGSSDLTPDEITTSYIEAMADLGFQSSPAAALEGSAATQFRRGGDGLVITVRARVGGGTELSLAGTLVRGG